MSKPEHVSVVLARIMARIQEGTRERQEGMQDAGRYVGLGEERKCSQRDGRADSGDVARMVEGEEEKRGQIGR